MKWTQKICTRHWKSVIENDRIRKSKAFFCSSLSFFSLHVSVQFQSIHVMLNLNKCVCTVKRFLASMHKRFNMKCWVQKEKRTTTDDIEYNDDIEIALKSLFFFNAFSGLKVNLCFFLLRVYYFALSLFSFMLTDVGDCGVCLFYIQNERKKSTTTTTTTANVKDEDERGKKRV